MKSQNRVSQLTLELYHRGLTTNKERKLVEDALETDNEVRKRYEALQESYREIQQLLTNELSRLGIPEMPPTKSPRKKTVVAGFILAAVVLLCVLFPAILHRKSTGSNKDNAIAEETSHETNTQEIDSTEERGYVEEMPNVEIASPPEPSEGSETGNFNGRIEIAEEPSTEGGVYIAAEPVPDTGIRLRGEGQSPTPPVTVTTQEEQPNINIPPGITFIFENMFANRGLTFVIIPSRITSIGKNAFQDNPLLSVTIGANVSMEGNAIPGNFAAAYNANGKAAGTYARPDTHSDAWEKK